jgi:ATP-dependent DNA helicase RecG
MVPPPPTGFERSAVPGCDLDDLDMEALTAYLQRRAPSFAETQPVERLAQTLGLITGVGSRVSPSAVGLLCFGHLPQLARPEWGIAAVRIKGSSMADPIGTRVELEGQLRALLDGGLAFVREQTRDIEGELAEYPKEAVREALVNALVHRDYRLTARISLRIFDDRLEIWSPGGMASQLDPEQLARVGGISFARNPILAATARTLGLVDQIGRGMPTIRRAVHESCGRDPVLRPSGADFLVQLPSRLSGYVDTSGPTN